MNTQISPKRYIDMTVSVIYHSIIVLYRHLLYNFLLANTKQLVENSSNLPVFMYSGAEVIISDYEWPAVYCIWRWGESLMYCNSASITGQSVRRWSLVKRGSESSAALKPRLLLRETCHCVWAYYWFTVCHWALAVGQRSLCALCSVWTKWAPQMWGCQIVMRASERYTPSCRMAWKDYDVCGNVWRGSLFRNVYRTLEIQNLVFTTVGRQPEGGVYSGLCSTADRLLTLHLNG